ncbi:lipopolysaccharide biosynthesis protein [Chelativorans sp. ZYF759]|uniref:lipopolysaccharide biosynthesis protein n=1 Tax=Chelativorans sp. ZYF759 TaxID=2692213 RepID=UPI00145E6967|nr:lipopolysaccharide biosynthesis protein [Chelativorans sp. ZYF759]NMG41741.1 lipopolysaccharide biosynthesis protein [Chelativorans sp. ZYF759]
MAFNLQAIANPGRVVRDYLAALSGSGGRLVFSLLYFVVLANTLSIAEFGLFATASATGVVLSRILSFGYVSPLYRIATVRPSLIGTYTAGFLFMSLLSLPVLAIAAYAMFELVFAGQMAILTFLLIVGAEALLWRPTEAVIIVNNGMGRFGRGAILVVAGTVMRALAALALMLSASQTLADWALLYLLANAAVLALAVVAFQPRQRLRLRPRLCLRHLRDSLSVCLSDILFYVQMELDKLMVLALGGAQLAGIYAIIMRLVDLTAVPIRTFSMMLVQSIMKRPDRASALSTRALLEVGVFAVSTLGISALALILHIRPGLLGANIAQAAPLVLLALLVPGLRNLVEYHAELLYARGQTLVRAFNLALLAGVKAVLLAWILTLFTAEAEMVLWLNGAFAVIYAASALLTYTAMRMPARPL